MSCVSKNIGRQFLCIRFKTKSQEQIYRTYLDYKTVSKSRHYRRGCKTYHESLVEIGSQQIVDELRAPFLLSSSGLVFEHNIIVPSSFQVEVLRVQQRIALGNVDLALLFFLGGPFTFLEIISKLPKKPCPIDIPLSLSVRSFLS